MAKAVQARFTALKEKYFSFNKIMACLLLLLLLTWVSHHFLPKESSFGDAVQQVLNTLLFLLLSGALFVFFIEFLIVGRRLSVSLTHLIKSRLGIRHGAAPEGFVRHLFDEYAEKFDDHLLRVLEYKVPEHIDHLLKSALSGEKQSRILDMGCGTGLCGEFLKNFATELIGVDLSPKMIQKAQALGVYDRLICDSFLNLDQLYPHYFDLVVAADVFVYFGNLESVFEQAVKILKPNGLFVFSVERFDGSTWVINQNGRYAHSEIYIKHLLGLNGFTLIAQQAQTLRLEDHEPVSGHLYVARLQDTSQLAKIWQNMLAH